MSRRRGSVLRGTILTGIGLMPVVCAVTFFGLSLVTGSVRAETLQPLETLAQDLLAYAGLGAEATAPGPGALALVPTLQLQPTFPAIATNTTTPTVTPTETPSPSATPTNTATETGTSTLTATPSSTITPTATRTPSATRTRTPIPPSRTPTRTLTRTATQPPSPTPTHTATRAAPPPPSPTSSSTPESQPTDGSTSEVTPTVGDPTNTPTIAPTVSTCDAAPIPEMENQVISLVNAERVAQGLAAYEVEGRLTAAARVHAADMACNHFTSHTGSDGSSVRDRVERQGYSWSWIGENYYVTGDTANGAQIAFDWWMNSTLHRNNLLSPNYTQFGIGYIYDADSHYRGYFVAVFARPK